MNHCSDVYHITEKSWRFGLTRPSAKNGQMEGLTVSLSQEIRLTGSRGIPHIHETIRDSQVRIDVRNVQVILEFGEGSERRVGHVVPTEVLDADSPNRVWVGSNDREAELVRGDATRDDRCDIGDIETI